MVDGKNKMMAKIDVLVETVAELTHENNSIKKILYVKQTEWVNVESKSSSKEKIQKPEVQRKSILMEIQY